MGTEIQKAFESGYSNATNSLSQMIKRKIQYNTLHSSLLKVDSINLQKQTINRQKGADVLITTELFGDVTGKSYLLLSQPEYDLITAGIPESKDPTIDLREEFLKEVDNILSASVITRLSNQLNLRMYGDVPLSMGRVNGRLEDIIYDDFNEDNEELYVNTMCFVFDEHPSINPLFVWVLDESIQKIQAAKPVL